MHIAILSDPHNFHTQKWAKALQEAGAKVTVFGFEPEGPGTPPYVRLQPRYARAGRASYLSYLAGGRDLRQALEAHQIDVLNPLNITPFGVWGRQSGFHPVIQSALGADILEYPPRISQSPELKARAWSHIEGQPGLAQSLRYRLGRQFYRRQVLLSLQEADLVTGDNQHLLDRMEQWFGMAPAKMKELIYGVEPELFEVSGESLAQLKQKLGILSGQRVILSPRGAKAVYQADIILEGFARVLEAGICDHKFILLGAGYEVSQKVAARAAELEGRFPQFCFVPGRMPREELYALWNLTDLFVSAPVYDGYSAALAEGRYAGAMPVVNAIPANLEVIQHERNGWIIENFTSANLRDALLHLIPDLETWKKRISQPNRDWIEAHSLVRNNAAMFLNWAGDLCKRTKQGGKAPTNPVNNFQSPK
ncbi:MAG: glycosyltransferase family 4 protein [Bacteroidia bacterium]|nr:glycosyltransferase family 4 protein [Bacteroidia bacterium]